MQKSYDYDAIVIGSGPGGEGAAMGLVKQGARIAVIERYHNIGGGCTHWAPSLLKPFATPSVALLNSTKIRSTAIIPDCFAPLLPTFSITLKT